MRWLRLPWFVAAVAALTVVLGLTGGPMNPFSLLYLVLALGAALTLEAAGAWAVVLLGGAAYGALFLPPFNPHAHHLDSHLLGMWFAYATVAPLTTFAVRRLRVRLARATEDAARSEKLAALATLAAGAAHELATPLSTIRVVAHELARGPAAGDDRTGRVAEDAALIEAEVERATEVLGQLSADASAGMGEAAEALTVGELIDAGVARLSRPDRVRHDRDDPHRAAVVRVPPRQAARALRGVLANAREAGGEAALSLERRNGSVLLYVDDDGPGLSDAQLARIGEPFFTTKPPGEGMGLGVFFARAVVVAAGGTLSYERRPEGGTRARIELPAGDEA